MDVLSPTAEVENEAVWDTSGEVAGVEIGVHREDDCESGGVKDGDLSFAALHPMLVPSSTS